MSNRGRTFKNTLPSTATCEHDGCDKLGKLYTFTDHDRKLQGYVCDRHWDPLQDDDKIALLRKLTPLRDGST
jgi:hypothetical protein